MPAYTILHNPRCRKSREALALLNQRGIDPEVRLYLSDPLDGKELETLLDQLDLPPEALARQGEAQFREHARAKKLSRSEWIKLYVRHPKLIERPVVISGKRAIIARPVEKLHDWLDGK